MKCVQNKDTGEVRRVSDLTAMKLVINEPWRYVRKDVWKAQRAGAMSELTNEGISNLKSCRRRL